MGWYVVRRLLAAAALVVLVPSLSFAWFTAVYVGGPVLPQLADYVSATFLHFDLSSSTRLGSRGVADVLLDGIPVDVALLVGGFGLGIAGGMLAGAQVAAHPHGKRAKVLNGIGAVALSAPAYATAFLIIVYFGSVGGTAALPFVSDSGVYEPLREDPAAWLHALWVPWLAIALPVAGAVMRLAASATRDALDEDPVRTARAKGIADERVVRRHALPFAVNGVSAYTGASMNILILNAAVVERLFNLPGSFRIAQDSVQDVDFPAIQGLVLITAFYVAAANLVADLVLARVDPRVRR